MAAGDAARSRDRGGGSVQATRPRWPRLTRIAGALLVAGLLGAYPPVSAAKLAWLHAGISVLAIALLAVGLAFRRPALFLWSLLLLGGNYALWLALGTHAIDQRAPIVGAGLLLTAELAFDSIEPEVGPDATVVLSRAIALALTVLGGAGVGAVILAVSSIPLSGGVVITALGAAAAVLALGLLMRLAVERR